MFAGRVPLLGAQGFLTGGKLGHPGGLRGLASSILCVFAIRFRPHLVPDSNRVPGPGNDAAAARGVHLFHFGELDENAVLVWPRSTTGLGKRDVDGGGVLTGFWGM